MASGSHLVFEDLPAAARELLERTDEAGEVFIDAKASLYKISRFPARTAAEALALLKNDPRSEIQVDEGWTMDMDEVLSSRQSEASRDPWA